MNHTSRGALALFVALAPLVASCRQDQLPSNWVDPRLSAHMQFSVNGVATRPAASIAGRDAGALKIWRGGVNSISVDSVAAIADLKKVLGQSAAVVVTFSPGSRLGDELAEDRLTLAFHAGDEKSPGFALVGVPGPLVLEGLAAAAHVANNHACGNLEVLSLAPLTDAGGLTPPVFEETVKLDGVEAMLAVPTEGNVEKTIDALEKMGTRYHTSDTGLATTDKVQALFTAAGAASIAGAAFSTVDHDIDEAPIRTKQKSLIFAIPGTDDDETTVVIGGHLDSINRNGVAEPAPGSDDDASGIATMVEMVRAIAQTGMKFKRRIEFQAYAAEEVGLIGSGLIARQYARDGRKVSAMFQLDMNSWAENAGAKTIYLVENDTSPTLRRSVKDLLNTYLAGDYVEDSLSAGTSDHRSWTNAGYTAVFPFENPKGYNEALHSVNDNLKTINNLPLTARFAQLGLAFLAHHAGTASDDASYATALAAAKAARSPDLKLAIVKAVVDDTWQVSVAGPATLKTIELCTTAASGSESCVAERNLTTSDRTTADRGFFITKTLVDVVEGGHLAVFGYDAADHLVAQRTVLVKKK